MLNGAIRDGRPTYRASAYSCPPRPPQSYDKLLALCPMDEAYTRSAASLRISPSRGVNVEGTAVARPDASVPKIKRLALAGPWRALIPDSELGEIVLTFYGESKYL
jgi:hypothetical protein